jgi:hypothetical protein
MKILLGALLWSAFRRVMGGGSPKPEPQQGDGRLLAYSLAYLTLQLERREALQALLAAKHRALYRGQTLEDVLDPNWMSKPSVNKLLEEGGNE